MSQPDQRGCHGQIRDDDQGFVKGHCPIRERCYRYKMTNAKSRGAEWAPMGYAPYDFDTGTCAEYWRK